MDTNQPSQPPSAATIEAGQKALAQGAWREARSAFELAIGASDAAKHFSRALLEPGENAEIFSGLAEAMWWLGEIRESLECWERAYSEFRRQPDAAQAASVAIQLAVIYDANLGNQAAAAGWVARATRLVDEHALEPLRGWVLIASATDSDPGQHEALARQVYRLGRTSGDRHLELCALTQIGVALIDQGRITEGMTFHDEAMAGALAGEGELETVAFTACEMMDSYSRCAQYQRMAQWIRAADRFVERYGCPYLNASCRTHYGEVLFVSGEWRRAALAIFEDFGAVKDAESTTILLREMEIQARKQTGRTPHPQGLTPREVEVLRLVAQGLSDKEIATRLVLSRHTVHRHIHSILTKLDLPSRTAAAAYAVRHGLL